MTQTQTKTHCQICGRLIQAKTGRIAHHGYTRPGDGWQTPSCMGAKYRPYEVACDALPRAITAVTEHIATREAVLADLLANPPRGIETNNHRRSAYNYIPKSWTAIPCRVVAEANPARAAEIWLGVNRGRRAVRPINGFLVAVVAKQEPEVTINSVVINSGYRVGPGKTPDNIAAVSALRTVYDRHGKQTLGSVLRVLRLIWGSDPHAVSSPLLRGFGLFLHEFNVHVDNKRLAARIGKKWSPYQLSESAEARKQSTMERLDQAISELLLREYNSGLKEHRLRHKP